MLSIPEAIKTLFKTDGARKNFRAHFCNGERADITNSDVVTESVRFTESICSGETVRFGLTEASMIEFETVGVENISGAVIDCGIEIDTTPLSAAQLSAIAADPGDGVLVLAAASDIGWGFYRIPYGRFRVSACPRNQGAMTHRRVTAYSLSGGKNLTNSPVEDAKLRTLIAASVVSNYTPSIPKLIYAAMGWWSPSVMDAFPKSSGGSWAIGGSLFEQWESADETITVQVSMMSRRATFSDADEIYQLDMSGWDAEAVGTALDWVNETVAAFGGDGASARAAMQQAIAGRMPGGFRFTGDLPVFYPYFVTAATVIPQTLTITLPTTANITVTATVGGSTQTETYSIAALFTSPAVAYKFTTNFPDVRGNYAPTANNERPGRPGFSFVNAYDIAAVTNGWLELNGKYARPGRSGGCDIVSLDSSAPAEIGPGDMPEFWWDEYDISPVGRVKYSYGSGAEAQVIELVIGDGGSVYDLTDNVMLAAMASASPSAIEAILQSGLIPELSKVTYTPVELTMRSWPWIQAGDALELTAEDGTVVNTFAMSRSISGIQLLMDAIESEGGEVMEG